MRRGTKREVRRFAGVQLRGRRRRGTGVLSAACVRRAQPVGWCCVPDGAGSNDLAGRMVRAPAAAHSSPAAEPPPYLPCVQKQNRKFRAQLVEGRRQLTGMGFGMRPGRVGWLHVGGVDGRQRARRESAECDEAASSGGHGDEMRLWTGFQRRVEGLEKNDSL